MVVTNRLGDGAKARLGMAVTLLCDPRHEGRLEKITNNCHATVRWASGWVSDDLTLAELGAYKEE